MARVTLHNHLNAGACLLSEAKIEEPWREVRLLAAHVLQCRYEDIFFNPNQAITPALAQVLEGLVARRCQGEPLAKIIGYKEFWGLKFAVTGDTLDPRPDSETLIETLQKYLPDKEGDYRFLDLGTGSGCLIIAALHDYKNATGVAVDKSRGALTVAQENCASLDVAARCSLVQGDWVSALAGEFDAILINPPYIAREELLSGGVLYDPPTALYAEDNGLKEYKMLSHNLHAVIGKSSFIFMEIGASQAQEVSNIFKQEGYVILEIVKDIGNHDRCLVIKK